MLGRKVAAALLLPFVPLLASAAPVAAANNVTILGFYNDCQFTGANAGSGKTVKIDWRDSSGNIKSEQSVKSNTSGQFVTNCDAAEVIETGDTLKTTIGSSVRSFTLPQVTANVDRDADTVSGKVSPAPTNLFVDVRTFDGGFNSSLGTLHESNPTPVSGSYTTTSWDTTPDIKGWDAVDVVWQDARGDVFVRPATAEGIRVWERQSFFNVAGNPRDAVDVSLLTSASALRDEVTGRVNQFGGLTSEFLDPYGDSLRINAGDRISATFASDADFSIPNLTATANKTTDHVSASCGLASVGIEVDVYTRDLSNSAARTGFTDGSGNFIANFATSPTFNIVSGTKIDVLCKLVSGDEVARVFTVA